MYNANHITDMFYHQSQYKLNNILETPQKMYHYTNIDVLKSIVEGKLMYATHINFMNDWEEFQTGYSILNTKIKEALVKYRSDFIDRIGEENLKIVESYFSEECLKITEYYKFKNKEKFEEFRSCTLPEVYTISFCKEKDLLSQWAIYAKESGVAIEFDFSDFILCDASLSEADKRNFGEREWQEIKYFRNNKAHIINYSNQDMKEELQEQIVEVIRKIKDVKFGQGEKILRPAYLIRILAELYSIVPYYKTDKFKAENEIRIAFMRLEEYMEDKKWYKTKVFYRTANNVLKPYLRIGWEALKKNTYPIKKIIIGPGNNQEAVFRGLIHFIENQEAEVIPDCEGKKPFSMPMVDGSYKTCRGIIIEKSKTSYIF